MKNLKYILIVFILLFSASAFSQKSKNKYKKLSKISRINIENDSLSGFLISIKDSLRKAEIEKDTFKIAENNMFLAKLYNKLGSFDDAIEYNLEAIKLFVIIQDTTYLMSALHNISGMYGFIGNHKASIEFSEKNLNIAKLTKDTSFMVGAYLNIAASYVVSKRKKSEIMSYFNKAIRLAELTNDKRRLVYIYNNIGSYYTRKNMADSAKFYFLKSVHNIVNKKKNKTIAAIYSNIADVEYSKGNFERAIFYSKTALDYFENKNMHWNGSSAYRTIINSLAKLNMPEEIPSYFEKYEKVLSEIKKKHKAKQFAKMKILYDIDKFESKIKILTAENKLRKTELASSRIKLYLLGLIILLILVILLVFVIQNSRIKKSHIKIVNENVKVFKIEKEIAELKNITQNKNYASTNLEINNIVDELYLQIVEIMESKKLYKNKDLSLDTLSKELNTNRNYLSRSINSNSNKTFSEFVNDYRISEAKKLLCNNSLNMSVEGIGSESGFNSKSTFFRVFKKVTGVTPSFFMENAKGVM